MHIMVIQYILIITLMTFTYGLRVRWAFGSLRFESFPRCRALRGRLIVHLNVILTTGLLEYGLDRSSVYNKIRNTGLQVSATALRMVDVPEFGDDDDNFGDGEEQAACEEKDNRTDMEKGLTHGYEGNFKVGDNIRVKDSLSDL